MVNLVLLGQYGVSGKLTGEFSDLFSNQQIKLELEEDGLLWATTTATTARTLPLLRSTRVLLRAFKVPVPGDEDSYDDDLEEEDTQEDTAERGDDIEEHKDEDMQDAENEATDDEDMMSLEGDDGDDGNDEKEKAQCKESSTKIRPGDEPYQSLERSTNTVEKMLNALLHIQAFRREVSDGSKVSPRERRGMTPNQRRLKALEHQRDRLQKQLATVDDESSNNDDVDEENNVTDPMDNPWIHLARILNSIRVLTPVLLPILMHQKRNDAGLLIRGDRINKHTKRPTCWLIGEHVYDRCKTSTCNKIYRHLVDIYGLLKVPQKDVKVESTVWRSMLQQLMNEVAMQSGTRGDVVLSSSSPSKMPTIYPQQQQQLLRKHQQHPFDDETFFGKDRRDSLEKLAQSWDEELGLREEKNIEEHRLYEKATHKLHARISKLVKHVFPDAVLSIYGSCLSDLSLGKSSDVDLSIHIEEAERNKEAFENGNLKVGEYEQGMKRIVYRVCRKLQYCNSEFREMHPVTRARVPVIMGTYNNAKNPYTEDGSLAFDICFLNDIAVANSSLLREYSLVDSRAKQLMVAVKRWSKCKEISSAKDNTFSSYTWTNMVVFYLQNIGLVPNLQNRELLEKTGVAFETNNRCHSVNNLDTRYVKWENAKKFWSSSDELSTLPVSALLYGFFRFYSCQFLSSLYLVSIKRGRDVLLPKTVFRSATFGFVIEDPFETWDSHCPHDLGGHASAKGMVKIIRCFNEAEDHLRKAFISGLGKNATIPAPSLWSVKEETKTSDDTARGGKNGDKQLATKSGNKRLEKGGKKFVGKVTGIENGPKHGGKPKGDPNKRKSKSPQRQKKGKEHEDGAHSKHAPVKDKKMTKKSHPATTSGELPDKRQQQEHVTNGDIHAVNQHPRSSEDKAGEYKRRNRRRNKAKSKQLHNSSAISESGPSKNAGDGQEGQVLRETKEEEKPAKKDGGEHGHSRRPRRRAKHKKPAADGGVAVDS